MSNVTTVDLGLAESGLATGCADCGGRTAGGGCGCGGGCGHDEGCGCGGGTLERPRWFAGQLVGPADLEALQQWVIGQNRRHNRLLHGWGVVCGLAVRATTLPATGEAVPWSVTVDSGLALSGCGDEVVVPGAVRVDIRQPRPSGSDVCAPPVDPWCAPVRQRRDPDRTYYLAVRYAEERRRPVPTSSCGCGCGDDPCEYSRIAESVAIAVLDELPDCYAEVKGRADQQEELRRSAAGCSDLIRETGTRPCPDCCTPWVVLADLRVSADGTVDVDPLTHRRFVAALPGLAFTCAPGLKDARPALSDAAREAIAGALAGTAAKVAETGEPEHILATPAALLRGARASTTLKELVGERTVAELAAADVVALRAEAAELDVDPEAVTRLHGLANVVAALAGR